MVDRLCSYLRFILLLSEIWCCVYFRFGKRAYQRRTLALRDVAWRGVALHGVAWRSQALSGVETIWRNTQACYAHALRCSALRLLTLSCTALRCAGLAGCLPCCLAGRSHCRLPPRGGLRLANPVHMAATASSATQKQCECLSCWLSWAA